MTFIQQSIEEAKLTVEQEAKKIIINTIQRIGTEEVAIAVSAIAVGSASPAGSAGCHHCHLAHGLFVRHGHHASSVLG